MAAEGDSSEGLLLPPNVRLVGGIWTTVFLAFYLRGLSGEMESTSPVQQSFSTSAAALPERWADQRPVNMDRA
ncbi:MAG: hypothetical protein ACLU9S_24620 [Oscillospiraceae bacterium]